MGNELVVTPSQLKVYNVQEKVLASFKVAESLKCEDTKSRKVLAKFRSNAKSLRAKIIKARLDKNRVQVTLNNEAAKAINDRLSASIEAYDNEIKAYDQGKIDKANEEKQIEDDRLKGISDQIKSLTDLIATTLEYNIPSYNVNYRIRLIEMFDISEEIFQEKTFQAELLKTSGLAQAQNTLEARKNWEKQLSDIEKHMAENKKRQAEIDRIEKETEEKLKAEQDLADKKSAEIKKKEEELKAREKAVKDLEEGAASKAKLEKTIAFFAEMAEDKETQLEKQRLEDFDTAMKDNAVFDAACAMAESIDTDIKNEQLKADKVRAGLIVEDKKVLQDEINKIADFVSQMTGKHIKTDSAQDIYMSMQVAINKALVFAEIEGQELI